MPRKRKKRVIPGSDSVPAPVLSLQNDEGFYPYRLSYEVVDKQDNLIRVFLGPVPSNHADGAKDTSEVLERITLILAIYKMLRTIFLDEKQANEWVNKSNTRFTGKSALTFMLEGDEENIIKVHRYLYEQTI